MHTILFSHPACLGHETPPGHPESVDRLRAVLSALESEDFFYLHREEAPEATREHLVRAHYAPYVDAILAMVPEEGEDWVYIDPDTALAPGSREAMLRAAGAAVAAVDAVAEGRTRNAFCAVRPPGHHATPGQAMGFCFFNNVAVGAHHARAAHGFQRVAVVDFDVHHGNGTQDIFWSDPDLFYASTHQGPLFPGTGLPKERGTANNVLNLMMAAGTGPVEFRQAVDDRLLPALDAFAPDFLFISAGFDAHRRDPLAHFNLGDVDFAWITRELMAVADAHCGGRVVSTLEGGYDLQALASSTAAHVRALMGA